jgi:signal transduction histidine kinase
MTQPEALDPGDAFPVVACLVALDAWQQDPTTERLATLRAALRSVVAAAGAEGAYLAIDAPPLRPLHIGVGTLEGGPEATGRSESFHALQAQETGARLGSLWLDADTPEARVAVRALELAVDSCWSRATVRQTAGGLASLDEATRGIAGVLSLDEVLQVIVDRVRQLVRARYAALGIVDDEGRIERFITSGLTAEERARIGPLPEGHGLLGLIIREGRTYRIAEIADHPDSSGFPPNHPPMHSFLGVPVTAKGRPVGNLYLTDKEDAPEFHDGDERLVELFALHAGIAIDNARLHAQVQRLAVVEERDRIGRDLHDGIIQSLYAVALSLEDVPDLIDEDRTVALTRIDRAIDSLNVAIRDIRNFIFGLQPEALEWSDLGAGLTALVDEFRLTTIIDIELQVDDGAIEVARDTRRQVVHIVRGALSNAARHAGATHVVVALRVGPDGLSVSVSDDGRGFDPANAGGAGHFGLANMTSRAASIGAELTIDSAPGSGTRIIVRIPAMAAKDPGQ